MATQLFLLDTFDDTQLGTDNANLRGSFVGWNGRALGTARGSGVVASDNTATVTGTTAGVEIQIGATAAEWISPPVSADVTISGTITLNIWAEESNMSANVAINGVVEVIRANVTGTRNSNTLVEIGRSARVTEVAVGVGARAVNNFTFTPTSTVVNRGDRLRVRIFGDDVGTMASGFTFDIGYNGTTGAADGDSYVSFTETFSFESAPAGTQLFLTDTAVTGKSTGPALVSDFTGADENPLSEGGNWAILNSGFNALQRISNAVTSASAGSPGQSYWTPANFGPDLEAYVTIPNTGTAAGLLLRLQGEGGVNTWDGYGVLAVTTQTQVNRYTNTVSTNLLTSSAFTWAAGDKIGARIQGSLIQVFRQPSGGSTWNLIATTADTTYASAGKIGLWCTGNTGRLDDLYASSGTSSYFETTREAWTSRGSGVVSDTTNTVAGWTVPLQVTDTAAGPAVDWYTKQLTAFTLTGLAQANLRALQSSLAANSVVRCQIARVDSDGTNPTVWADWCQFSTDFLGTTEKAMTVNVSGDDLAISNGQRLRIRVSLDDAQTAAMASGFTAQVFYNGTSAAASGDSYVTLAQSVTEFVSGSIDDKLEAILQAVNRSSVW